MVSRLLLVYAVVELAVIFALVATIGWGWTLLIALATFVLGWGLLIPMAGSQLVHQLAGIRSGLREPQRALGDGALVALAMALVLVPGFVTTAMGLLLLVPPTRAAARPALTAMAVRALRGRVPLVVHPSARGDY